MSFVELLAVRLRGVRSGWVVWTEIYGMRERMPFLVVGCVGEVLWRA